MTKTPRLYFIMYVLNCSIKRTLLTNAGAVYYGLLILRYDEYEREKLHLYGFLTFRKTLTIYFVDCCCYHALQYLPLGSACCENIRISWLWLLWNYKVHYCFKHLHEIWIIKLNHGKRSSICSCSKRLVIKTTLKESWVTQCNHLWLPIEIIDEPLI